MGDTHRQARERRIRDQQRGQAAGSAEAAEVQRELERLSRLGERHGAKDDANHRAAHGGGQTGSLAQVLDGVSLNQGRQWDYFDEETLQRQREAFYGITSEEKKNAVEVNVVESKREGEAQSEEERSEEPEQPAYDPDTPTALVRRLFSKLLILIQAPGQDPLQARRDREGFAGAWEEVPASSLYSEAYRPAHLDIEHDEQEPSAAAQTLQKQLDRKRRRADEEAAEEAARERVPEKPLLFALLDAKEEDAPVLFKKRRLGRGRGEEH